MTKPKKNAERRNHIGKQMPLDIREYELSDKGRGAKRLVRLMDKSITRYHREWVIEQHIMALKPWQKKLVALAFDGYSYPQLARATGKRLSTVYENIEIISKIFRRNAKKTETPPPFRHTI